MSLLRTRSLSKDTFGTSHVGMSAIWSSPGQEIKPTRAPAVLGEAAYIVSGHPQNA